MNNNQIKFDPMTGQPIQPQNNGNEGVNNNQNINNIPNIQPINVQNNNIPNQVIQNNSMPQVNTDQMNNSQNVMNQMQNIATVDQSKEAFINNTQATVKDNTGDNAPKVNYVFVAIIFIIIFAAIFFLFPYLQKNL